MNALNLHRRRLCAAVTFIVAAGLGSPTSSWGQQSPLGDVDFRYSPPWWQSVISMPDDADKVLVGKEGQVLLDFKEGDLRNFRFRFQVEIGGPVQWKRQETDSARVPIVRTRMDAAGIDVTQEIFMLPPQAATGANGAAGKPPERRIVLLVTLKNSTARAASPRIGVSIRTADPVRLAESGRAILAGDNIVISTTEALRHSSQTSGAVLAPPGGANQGGYGNVSSTPAPESGPQPVRWLLPELVLKASESRQLVFTIDRHCAVPASAVTPDRLPGLRDAARQWWETAGLPYNAVQVPDPGIQAILESCVRNIWQARDIVDGQIAFKVGPTVYRKLVVVDGAFLMESAALLGRAKGARDGLEYLLGHQEADGAFEVMRRYYGLKGFWKENGIVLWAAYRHARLSQDKEWLRSKWPALRRTVDVIRRMRAETMKTPGALDYGLIPAGFIDGGLNNQPPDSKPEYSNVYWNLTGWKAAIEAAHWLGDEETAAKWQPEFDEFYAAYRNAAARDTLKDPQGNPYVPMMMANAGAHLPARGQWAFCHAVYPGGIFPPGDPLVEGQLAMLRATKVEGMVFDTGWMKSGIWTYFASFYGHAMLWQGHGREAANALYDFARHAAPLGVWREEQKPSGKGAEEVGDMPHNWASAEFIRLATHLIELDRGDELHLLEGFPREWAVPGMVTRLSGVLTPFGPLHLELRVAQDGRSARLKVGRLAGKPDRMVLHLGGLTGEDKTRSLTADADVDVTIPIAGRSGM